MKLSQKVKDKIWWLVISADYDYDRLTIAEHELNNETLTLWIEDKMDFKNSLDECLRLDFSHSQFARVIASENLNSYEGVNAKGHKVRIQIAEPIEWYLEDAAHIEQQWAREAILKKVLMKLVEGEISHEN